MYHIFRSFLFIDTTIICKAIGSYGFNEQSLQVNISKAWLKLSKKSSLYVIIL